MHGCVHTVFFLSQLNVWMKPCSYYNLTCVLGEVLSTEDKCEHAPICLHTFSLRPLHKAVVPFAWWCEVVNNTRLEWVRDSGVAGKYLIHQHHQCSLCHWCWRCCVFSGSVLHRWMLLLSVILKNWISLKSWSRSQNLAIVLNWRTTANWRHHSARARITQDES